MPPPPPLPLHPTVNVQCNDLLDDHKVDEEAEEDDEKCDVEDGILDECSQYLLPNTEVAGQHKGLS